MVLTEMDINHMVKHRLRKVVPVSSKKDPICANTIYLSPTKPITVGRTLSKDVQVKLLSKSTPLMISRKHASLQVDESGMINVEDHNVSRWVLL